MTSIIALFAGSAGRYLIYAALAATVAGGAAWVLHTHDARVRAEQQVVIDAATAVAVAEDNARAVSALEQTAAEATARADSMAQIRERIHAQPATTACLNSPAIRALAAGLLGQSGGGPGAASGRAGKPASVPGSATVSR